LFLGFVDAGFGEFSRGVRRLHELKNNGQININVTPYFATRLLIPALPAFRQRHKNSDLRLTTRLELPDFGTDDIDLAIQWGYGDWNGLDSQFLLHDHKMICCAPGLVANAKGLKTPAELLNYPLLKRTVTGRLWPDVLSFLGLSSVGNLMSDSFDDAATMRHATHAGMGIGLISKVDALQDIRDGKLVAPLGENVIADLPLDKVPAFYLVRPDRGQESDLAEAFIRWLLKRDWKSSSFS
jgi:LysR family glycine cleavage system transcriptional activator